MMPDDADAVQGRKDIADIPAMMAERGTARIGRAAIMPNPALHVHRIVQGLARKQCLSHALRAWALIVAEHGAPRLPGGALADAKAGLNVIGVDTDPDAPEPLWLTEFHVALLAALDRDGEGLLASMERVYGRADPQEVRAYTASFALTAVSTFDTTGASPNTIRLLHLLGSCALDEPRMSVAGVAFRLIRAVQQVAEMGREFTSMILVPELDAAKSLPPEGRAYLLRLLSAAGALIIGGKPTGPMGPIELQSSSGQSDELH